MIKIGYKTLRNIYIYSMANGSFTSTKYQKIKNLDEQRKTHSQPNNPPDCLHYDTIPIYLSHLCALLPSNHNSAKFHH